MPQPPSDAVPGSRAPANARSALLAQLAAEHRGAILAVCLAHTRDVHAAEDRVQDVFLKALDNLTQLRDPARARPWLLQIARRLCLDAARRHRPAAPLSETAAPAQPASAEAGERRARLLAALARLPEDQREAIALYYLDGRSAAAVAATLSITPAAARQRLVRARLRLYELLAGEMP